MASLMENLIDVLGRESTEYEALLQLSQRKTPIIAGGDLAELQKITDEEQEKLEEEAKEQETLSRCGCRSCSG